MRPTNLLFLFADQHGRDFLGCYGHPLVQTPNLDRLAAQGTRFTHGYTNCPICVPARAALHTGRYVHQIRNWNNAIAYDGRVDSWAHRLRGQGRRVDAIGKLHFQSHANDNGWSEEINTMHIAEGVGDILSCLRTNPRMRHNRSGVMEAGPGPSSYQQYDTTNSAHACRWLAEHAQDEQPWALFLSFACPHPPFIAPADCFELYDPADVPMPPQWQQAEWPQHPTLAFMRRFFDFEEPFDEASLRRLIVTYYAMCTFVDRQVGKVLETVDRLNLNHATRIIYSSDHGEHLGARGLVGKSTMYDESAAVPFIVAGPDVPVGGVVGTPVSLVDCFPTILEATGTKLSPGDADLPGTSLWHLAQAPEQERLVLSEYHALTPNAVYMLRNRRYKYIHYTYEAPQLFDLDADPREETDLAQLPEHQGTLEWFAGELRARLHPEENDFLAKADQQAVVDAFGGEEAVRRRGAFDNSPVPGEQPQWRTYGH
jgi:choline-sulfatase